MLPNFSVVGVPKGGTTSLYRYLRGHPDVFLPDQKELHFFSSVEIRRRLGGPGDEAAASRICCDAASYAAQFRGYQGQPSVGDVSPSYLFFPQCARRMRHALGADTKIIVSLREPVARAYSNYLHLMREGRETLTFLEALRAESARADLGWGDFWLYAEHSRYAGRVLRFVDTFGPSNVRVVLYEELAASPGQTISELFDFLGVDPHFAPPDLGTPYNRGGVSRSGAVGRLLRPGGRLGNTARLMAPDAARGVLRGARARLLAMNRRDPPPADPRAASFLADKLRGDREQLEELLGVRLDRWGHPSAL